MAQGPCASKTTLGTARAARHCAPRLVSHHRKHCMEPPPRESVMQRLERQAREFQQRHAERALASARAFAGRGPPKLTAAI